MRCQSPNFLVFLIDYVMGFIISPNIKSSPHGQLTKNKGDRIQNQKFKNSEV